MVRGMNKSGARKKKYVRTPSGNVTRYEEKRPGKARCACGRPLSGTARGPKGDVQKLSKTERRPTRPYGGQLCAVCTKALHRDKARLSSE